jgi:hypothetical protein
MAGRQVGLMLSLKQAAPAVRFLNDWNVLNFGNKRQRLTYS